MKHEITQRRAPDRIILTCACGWKAEITRRQNALARGAKARAAKLNHLSKNLTEKEPTDGH